VRKMVLISVILTDSSSPYTTMTEVATLTNGDHMNDHPDYEMGNGTATANLRFSSGLILPPPEIKGECFVSSFVHPLITFLSVVIDRTALYVARSANPPQFEERVREGQRSDPKFSFLNPADPYHAYYRHRMDKVTQGEVEDESAAKDKETEVVEPKEPLDIGVEPPAPDFILELPNISPIDL